MANAYLRSCWPDGDANFIEEHMDGIEKRYLAASPESLAHLRNGGCEPFAQSRMKKAMAYRRDMLLYSWVEEQNCDLGLTPPLREVYSKMQEIVVSLSPDKRALRRVPGERNKYRWVRKFKCLGAVSYTHLTLPTTR